MFLHSTSTVKMRQSFVIYCWLNTVHCFKFDSSLKRRILTRTEKLLKRKVSLNESIRDRIATLLVMLNEVGRVVIRLEYWHKSCKAMATFLLTR